MTDTPTAALKQERPIREALVELAATGRAPVAALKECMARCDEAVPVLRDLVALAAVQWPVGDEATLLHRGLHILASSRDQATCKLLLRLLQKHPENMFRLFSYTPRPLLRIFESVFDGDLDSIYNIIADESAHPLPRGLLLTAATLQQSLKDMPREPLVQLLKRLDPWNTTDGRNDSADEAVDENDDGFDDDDFDDDDEDDEFDGDDEYECEEFWMKAQLLAGIALNRTAPQMPKPEPDETSVAGAPEADGTTEDPAAKTIATKRGATKPTKSAFRYVEGIDDVIQMLSWDPDAGEDEDDVRLFPPSSRRAKNIWRNIGRNDPCPCGSGRKAKKCCWDVFHER